MFNQNTLHNQNQSSSQQTKFFLHLFTLNINYSVLVLPSAGSTPFTTIKGLHKKYVRFRALFTHEQHYPLQATLNITQDCLKK